MLTYRNGDLHIEDVRLADIAEKTGTPVYCYSAAQLTANFTAFRAAFDAEMPGRDVTICFACKANGNLAVLRVLQKLGAGADIVSSGEMTRALAAGIPASKIVFSGVGKTKAELERAVAEGLMQINVESEAEIETISAAAQKLGKTARIAIRVNPNVDAKTHAKITTGKKENKFGIDIDAAPALYERAAVLPGIEPVGVALHIGSQLTDLEPFRAAFTRVAELVRDLKKRGITLSVFDVGGGIGISYRNETPPDLRAYAAIVRETLGEFGGRFILEPGRAIAGNAGVLLTRVVTVKQGEKKTFLILDAAMNDLLRPALYDAHHALKPCREAAGKTRVYDVVGPVCETGDTFHRDETLPEMQTGDLCVLLAAGAYGAVMGSAYNARDLATEVMVSGKNFAVVRPPLGVEELMKREIIPDFVA